MATAFTIIMFFWGKTQNVKKLWIISILLYLFTLLNTCDAALTKKQRDIMIYERDWYMTESIKKSNEAYEHLNSLKPKQADIKKICQTAISGFIASFAVSGSKEKALVVVLTILAKYAEEGFGICLHSYELMQESKKYYKEYDFLQNCLAMDMTEKEYQIYYNKKNNIEYYECPFCGLLFDTADEVEDHKWGSCRHTRIYEFGYL